MTATTLINIAAPLTIKQALIIAERAERMEAVGMRLKRESAGAKEYKFKEI